MKFLAASRKSLEVAVRETVESARVARRSVIDAARLNESHMVDESSGEAVSGADRANAREGAKEISS